MKKTMFAASLASLILLLTGCVQHNTDVTIYADGSTDVSQTLLLSKELVSVAQKQDEDISKSLKEEVDSSLSQTKGVKTSTFENKDGQGVKVTKHFSDVEGAFKSEFFSTNSNKNPWKVNVDKHFFYSDTTIQGIVDVKDWLTQSEGLTETQVATLESVSDSIEFHYSITTPVQAISQNADKVEKNRTYTWNLNMEKTKTIELKYHVLNMTHVFVTSGIVVIVLLFLSFFLNRSRKNKRAVRKP